MLLLRNFIWSPAVAIYDGMNEMHKLLGSNRTKKILSLAIPILATTALAVAQFYTEKKVTDIAYVAFENYLKIGQPGENWDIAYSVFMGTIYKFFLYRQMLFHIDGFNTFLMEELSRYLNLSLYKNSNEQIYSNTEQNLIKLASDSSTKLSAASLTDRLYKMTELSTTTLSSALRALMQAGMGLYTLRALNAKYLIAPVIVGIIYSLVTIQISKASQFYTDKANECVKKEAQIKNHAQSNAKALHASNNTHAVATDSNKINDEATRYNRIASIYKVISLVWSGTCDAITTALSFHTFGYATYKGIISHNEKNTIEMGFEKIKNLFTFSDKTSADTLKLIGIAQEIRKANKVIEQPLRVAFNRTYEGEALKISNAGFNIKLNGKQSCVVRLPEIHLEQGQRLIITGESGRGKSTFMSLLYGFHAAKQIQEISGEVLFPTTIKTDRYKMRFIAQTESELPFRNIKKAILEKVKVEHQDEALLNNLVDATPNLHSAKDREDIEDLSGGQRKAMRLIAAIMNKPDVLLLDEAFSDLDSNTAEYFRNLIATKLPKAIVITVAHVEKGVDKTYGGFYHKQIDYDKCSEIKEVEQGRNR